MFCSACGAPMSRSEVTSPHVTPDQGREQHAELNASTEPIALWITRLPDHPMIRLTGPDRMMSSGAAARF